MSTLEHAGILWAGLFWLCLAICIFIIFVLPEMVDKKFKHDLAIEQEKTRQEIERTKQAQLNRDHVSFSK